MNPENKIQELETALAVVRQELVQMKRDRDILRVQVASFISTPKSRKVSTPLDVLSDGGDRKTMRDVIEAYIMPKVKFQRDADLFNMSEGSIGWYVVEVMEISPESVQKQVLWWGERTKLVKDLMREHRSTANRKIKMAVMKGT